MCLHSLRPPALAGTRPPPPARPLFPPAAKAIEGNLLFEQLSIPAKQAIVRSMTPQPMRAGDVIIRQVGAGRGGIAGRGCAARRAAQQNKQDLRAGGKPSALPVHAVSRGPPEGRQTLPLRVPELGEADVSPSHAPAQQTSLHLPLRWQGDPDAHRFYVLERGRSRRVPVPGGVGRGALGAHLPAGQASAGGGGAAVCLGGQGGGQWDTGKLRQGRCARLAACREYAGCIPPTLPTHTKSVVRALPAPSSLAAALVSWRLLYSAPRAATVKASADGKLWVMERRVYAAIKRSDQEQIAAEKRAIVERVPLLAVLAPVRGLRAGLLLGPPGGSTGQRVAARRGREVEGCQTRVAVGVTAAST